MAWLRRSGRSAPAAARARGRGAGASVPASTAFDGFRKELETLVGQLLPYGVDEFTPDVLDKMIEFRLRQHSADIWQRYAAFVEEAMPERIQAEAELAYWTVINEAAQRYLAELRTAREAAVRALLGPEPTQQRPEPHIPERTLEGE